MGYNMAMVPNTKTINWYVIHSHSGHLHSLAAAAALSTLAEGICFIDQNSHLYPPPFKIVFEKESYSSTLRELNKYRGKNYTFDIFAHIVIAGIALY